MNGESIVLTQRESEVAVCVERGWVNKRIASELCISEQTVKNHIMVIARKLGVENRTGIAVALVGRRVDPSVVRYARQQVAVLGKAIQYWERVIHDNELSGSGGDEGN